MKYLIKVAETRKERRAALAFIRKEYKARFGTRPGPSMVYILAYEEDTIIGSIALDFCDDSGQLPIERIYEFDRTKFPLAARSSRGAQFGRWIAKDSAVSLSLVYAGARHASRLGKAHGWLEHTEAVHRVLTKKGIIFYKIPGAKIVIEAVPKGDRPFYTQTPTCYIMILSQVEDALDSHIVQFMLEDKIEFDKSVLETPKS